MCIVEALTIYKDWCQHEDRAQETFVSIDLVDDFHVYFQNLTIHEWNCNFYLFFISD